MKSPRIRFESGPVDRLLGTGPTWLRVTGAVFLFTSLAVLAITLFEVQRLEAEKQAHEAELTALRAVDAAPKPVPVSVATPIETLRQWDDATARLNTPWSDVLDAIERSTGRGVALLALEPDAVTGTVAITAEARQLEDLLDYAAALGRDQAIADVRMTQHDLRAQDPGQPVRMTLTVSPGPLRR